MNASFIAIEETDHSLDGWQTIKYVHKRADNFGRGWPVRTNACRVLTPRMTAGYIREFFHRVVEDAGSVPST